jgi:hypothetical protein
VPLLPPANGPPGTYPALPPIKKKGCIAQATPVANYDPSICKAHDTVSIECWLVFDPNSCDVANSDSRHNYLAHGEDNTLMPIIDPQDLGGCTFLMPQKKDGQCFQAHIVRALEDYENELRKEPERIQFVCSVNDGQFQDDELVSYGNLLELVSYGDLLDLLELEDHGEGQPIPIAVPNNLVCQTFLMLQQEDSPRLHARIVQALEQPVHTHVSQVVEVHEKDLDNDGEITTKLLSTIAANNPITDVPLNSVCSSIVLLHDTHLVCAIEGHVKPPGSKE